MKQYQKTVIKDCDGKEDERQSTSIFIGTIHQSYEFLGILEKIEHH